MRLLGAFAVGVIGCIASCFAAIQLGAISEIFLGPTATLIFRIIVAGGGIAITIAFAWSVAKPDRRTQ